MKLLMQSNGEVLRGSCAPNTQCSPYYPHVSLRAVDGQRMCSAMCSCGSVPVLGAQRVRYNVIVHVCVMPRGSGNNR